MTEPTEVNLKVYSTLAGELPLMVQTGTPECFVLYSQALELQAEIKSLQSALAEARWMYDGLAR